MNSSRSRKPLLWRVKSDLRLGASLGGAFRLHVVVGLAGMLYAALLNRAPDPGGLATYTADIEQRGLAWSTASMMASAEYHNRLAVICPNPNDNAAMWPWHTAKSFAFNKLLHNAGSMALVCGGTKLLQKIDGLGDDSDIPVVEILRGASF